MTTSTPVPAPAEAARRGRVAEAVRGHPLLAFLVLAFGLGWPLSALPVLADHGVLPGGGLMADLGGDRVVAFTVLWLAMVPAALVVTGLAEGRAGLRTLARRALRWRAGPQWWLVALLALPVLTLAVEVATGRALVVHDLPGLLLSQAVGVATAVLVVNLAEETVWAGFVQTRLEQRHGLLAAAALTAVPFAGIHVPIQLLGDATVASVLLNTAFLLVFGVVMRLLMGVFRHATRDSLLAVAVLHAVSNATNSSDGIVATLVPGQQPVLGWLVAALVVSGATALAIRPRLRAARQARRR